MEKQLSQTVLSQYLSIKDKKEPENTQITNRKRKTISGEERVAKRHKSTNKMSNPPNHTPTKCVENPFQDMERRLETCLSKSISESVCDSMRELVDTKLSAAKDSMNDLVDTKLMVTVNMMTNAVNESIKSNQSMMEQWVNMDSLTSENRVLSSEIEKLKHEQSKLKKKLDSIENRGLENRLLLKGVVENADEDPSSLMNTVYHELSKTIDASYKSE